MINYTALKGNVEEEYQRYCTESNYDVNLLYEKLYDFLQYIVRKFMGQRYYMDEIDDVVNETMEVIASKGLREFVKKEAEFSTYCAAIAKNKVNNLCKKHYRMLLDVDGELENRLESEECYPSPEYQMMILEKRLDQIALAKKYIKMLMDWKQKPYRTVSCVFAMLLFHRYHPDTKELASPKWAYGELMSSTVVQGADRFVDEMQEWIPRLQVLWSDEFIDAMDALEDGIYVSDIVFGEHFKVKDFENWSLRLRQAIKKRLLETGETKYAAFEL